MFCRVTGRQAGIGPALHAVRRLRRDMQTFRQVFKPVRTFLPARFDGGQHLSGSVHRVQDEGYQGWAEFSPAIAQLAQEVSA